MAVHEERDFEGGEYKTRPGPVRDAASKRFSSLAIPLSSIAVLGDMDNDLAMFRKAGLSIAMGNASPESKSCDRVQYRRRLRSRHRAIHSQLKTVRLRHFPSEPI